MGHIPLKPTCGEGTDARTIGTNYLIVDTQSPYNIIPGRLIINVLGVVVSILYITLKYLVQSEGSSKLVMNAT